MYFRVYDAHISHLYCTRTMMLNSTRSKRLNLIFDNLNCILQSKPTMSKNVRENPKLSYKFISDTPISILLHYRM